METSSVADGGAKDRQPRSRWNLYVAALLAAGTLTAEEYKLALALMREIPGYRLEEKDIGDRRLRALAELDGRSFERARRRPTTRGLIEYSLVRTVAGRTIASRSED